MLQTPNALQINREVGAVINTSLNVCAHALCVSYALLIVSIFLNWLKWLVALQWT